MADELIYLLKPSPGVVRAMIRLDSDRGAYRVHDSGRTPPVVYREGDPSPVTNPETRERVLSALAALRSANN